MKWTTHIFIYSLIPESGNLTLIKATATPRIFREADAPRNAKVNLTAKLSIVIIVEIIG